MHLMNTEGVFIVSVIWSCVQVHDFLNAYHIQFYKSKEKTEVWTYLNHVFK